MLDEELCIAQPKYDGERMLIHIDNGNVYCTSRLISSKTNRYTENQDKLPILKEIFKDFDLGYTVLDCEAYSDDWSTSAAILGSLPERSIELQKKATMRFGIFDCLWYDGIEICTLTYEQRLIFANKIVRQSNYEPLHMSSIITENGIENFDNIDFEEIDPAYYMMSMKDV